MAHREMNWWALWKMNSDELRILYNVEHPVSPHALNRMNRGKPNSTQNWMLLELFFCVPLDEPKNKNRQILGDELGMCTSRIRSHSHLDGRFGGWDTSRHKGKICQPHTYYIWFLAHCHHIHTDCYFVAVHPKAVCALACRTYHRQTETDTLGNDEFCVTFPRLSLEWAVFNGGKRDFWMP